MMGDEKCGTAFFAVFCGCSKLTKTRRNGGARVTEFTGRQVLFSIGRKRVMTVFDGGTLTSDGGRLLLNRVDERLGLFRRMAEAISNPRQEAKARAGRLLTA